MQKIDNLLKGISYQKEDIQNVFDTISAVTGVVFNKKDIVFSYHKDVKKIQFNVIGVKKIKLVLCKDELQKKLKNLGFTLVL
jgi:hypothetical protein